jgi:hypothetical protein
MIYSVKRGDMGEVVDAVTGEVIPKTISYDPLEQIVIRIKTDEKGRVILEEHQGQRHVGLIAEHRRCNFKRFKTEKGGECQ